MCICTEHERAANAVLLATHDAVVYVQGGSRFASSGRKIKPMGTRHAGEVTGHTDKHIRNCLDIHQPTHQLSLRAWILMLMAGMDRSPLEELARQLDMVLIPVPTGQAHQDLRGEILNSGKEFGDVCTAIADALADKHITRKELARIRREIDESVVQLYALLAAVESEAQR